MSFKDCIATAVETGAVRAEKGAAAQTAYDEALQEALDEGLTESAAADAATLKAVEAMTQLTADKKWQRINQLRAAHRNYQRFNGVTNYQRSVDDFMEGLQTAQQRIIGRAQGLFVKNLEAYRPRAAGLIQPTRGQDEILEAVYGGNVGNPSARELAQEMINVENYLVDRANAVGASIPKNPNRRLPQIHDRLRLHRAGEDKWVADHLEDGVLDWDIMRYDGKYIPQAQREQILRTVYNTIVNEGYNKVVPGQGGGRGSLATELSRERFLYYKSADSWLRMNRAYGRGNVFQQFVGQIESMAMNIALMEKFGPNPDAGRRFVENTLNKRSADLQAAKGTAEGKGRTEKSKVDAATASLNDQFNIFSRRVMNGDENLLALSGSSIRGFLGTQALTQAYVSAVGDIGFGRHISTMNRLPLVKGMGSYINYFLPGGRGRKQAAIEALGLAESATTFASGYQRYFGPMQGNAVVRRFSDIAFRATFLTPHTQAAKWSEGMRMLKIMNQFKGQEFGNLPFRPFMEQYGITAADWDMLRAIDSHQSADGTLLRPNDLWNKGDARSRKVADKFQDFVLQYVDLAVPSTNLRTLSALGQGTPAGTLRGEALRTVGMIKTFGVLPYTLYGRDMMRRSSTSGKLAYLGSFLIWTTLMGALITQLKAVVAGDDFRDMSDPKFWATALINGGTLGMLGDIAVNGMASMFGGPVPDMFDDIRATAVETGALLAGGPQANPAGNVIRIGERLVPAQNFWQVRLLAQRAMWDSLLREADPAAYRRKMQWERRQARETGQQPFWPMGESAPQRGPNFGAALGQD